MPTCWEAAGLKRCVQAHFREPMVCHSLQHSSEHESHPSPPPDSKHKHPPSPLDRVCRHSHPQAADAQPASTPAPGHDTLWHDEEWEVGEESKWRDRDRLQDEKVAALKVAAAALLKLRSRRAQSEGAGAAGLQQSSSGISRARTISASWWDHIRMGSKVACEGGLRASSLVAASQVEVSICASSKPGSMKDDASAASMSGRRLTACSGDGLPPGSTGRGVDVERGGSARERRAAPATAGSSASEAGVRQLDGKGASAAGLSAPAAAEWGALKQPGQPGRGHGKLTRSAAIKRPLPMVALEIEQRLGDLFTGASRGAVRGADGMHVHVRLHVGTAQADSHWGHRQCLPRTVSPLAHTGCCPAQGKGLSGG